MRNGESILILENFLNQERGKRVQNSSNYNIIQIITQGLDGYPHVALLSVGEFYISGPDEIHFCVFANSKTLKNLEREPFVTLAFVHKNENIVIKVRSTLLSTKTIEDIELCFFKGVVTEEKIDRIDYAEICCSSAFTLKSPECTLKRWDKQWTLLEHLNIQL